jgi:hypothetical protein
MVVEAFDGCEGQQENMGVVKASKKHGGQVWIAYYLT